MLNFTLKNKTVWASNTISRVIQSVFVDSNIVSLYIK